MADRREDESEHKKFSTTKTNESIYNEIKPLEKTKTALERRNIARQMLEKQMKCLRTTTSPCNGKSPVTHVHSATATSDGEDESGNSVQSRLRSLHSGLNILIPCTSQAADSSSDDEAESKIDELILGKQTTLQYLFNGCFNSRSKYNVNI